MSDQGNTYRNALTGAILRLVSDLQLWSMYSTGKVAEMAIDELETLYQRLETQWDAKHGR